MATMKDVAKLANVDISTVSRALNNSAYVHPDTKSKVLAAVKELSYQPNILAQGLKKGKRHTIGVVLPKLHMDIFSEILQGIEKQARIHQYSTIICTTEDNPSVEKEILNRLRVGFIDGLLIAGTGKNNRILRDMNADGMSIVQIVRNQETKLSSVIANYETSAYEATKFLFKKGSRCISLINGNMELAPYRDRYSGYHNATIELGLDEIHIESHGNPNTFEYGYNSTIELLKYNTNIDAIMVAVDIQGIGVLRALKDLNIDVPNNIKVISLTGHSVGNMLETSMTAMEIPANEMGEKSSSMLIDKIENQKNGRIGIQHLTFQAVLTEREST